MEIADDGSRGLHLVCTDRHDVNIVDACMIDCSKICRVMLSVFLSLQDRWIEFMQGGSSSRVDSHTNTGPRVLCGNVAFFQAYEKISLLQIVVSTQGKILLS